MVGIIDTVEGHKEYIRSRTEKKRTYVDNRADFTGPSLTGNILPAGARPEGGREGRRGRDEEGGKQGGADTRRERWKTGRYREGERVIVGNELRTVRYGNKHAEI